LAASSISTLEGLGLKEKTMSRSLEEREF
jgi:hypothetical protein